MEKENKTSALPHYIKSFLYVERDKMITRMIMEENFKPVHVAFIFNITKQHINKILSTKSKRK